jgi:glutathione S-transferase
MMELRYSATSPYTRKVLVTAHETGQSDTIRLVPTAVSATKPNAELSAHNPLMKLPTLLTDDGMALFDSPVICAYLDSRHAGTRVIPADGSARWRALRMEALADGILDAAILCRNEMNARPAESRWAAWYDGQLTKVRQGLAFAENEVKGFGAEVDIGQIALGCCVSFLIFRKVDGGVDRQHARLLAWYERFAHRASMLATAPKD